MRVVCALGLIVAVATALPERELTEVEYEALWTPFQTQYNKVYHPAEVMTRYNIFKDNVDFINHHNKNLADKLGYTVGINEFADMTNAEFVRKYNGYNARAMPKKELNVELLDTANLDDSVDWTTKNAVTPVKNQGQCGSCWAFSTTGSTEGAYAIKTGTLKSFSEQELVDCAQSFGNQGCNGGLMDNGFRYIEAKGDTLESTYAYTAKTGQCSATKSSNPVVAVASYKDVAPKNEDQLKAAVAQQPVSIAIEADQSGFQLYKDGVFSGTCGNRLDHGVLLVGYGTLGGQDYWKVKNSWGTSWGKEGYILLKRGSGSGNAGQCGLASQPSYPAIGKAPPTPGKTHYGNPADGCEPDEQAVRVQGLAGTFCSPDCKSAACPTDVPAGVTAHPQCALQSTSGDKKCALICSPSTDEASLRAGDAQCGKATCQPIQGVGICTYGAGPSPRRLPLATATSPPPSSAPWASASASANASLASAPASSASALTPPRAPPASRRSSRASSAPRPRRCPSSCSSSIKNTRGLGVSLLRHTCNVLVL